MGNACPDRAALEALVLGGLSEEEAEALADHLTACRPCSEEVSRLERQRGPWIAGVRDPLAEDGHLAEPQRELAVELARAAFAREMDADGGPSDGGGARVSEIREYRLLEKLGEGGMGAVYKALHTKLKRIVALKILPARARSGARVARFEREMEAVGQLDHPNIVRAHDAGEFHGRHFLVMEYVDGCDLSRLARAFGRLPVPEACELVRQAALGLQHAHEKGLVHRDVKPSNLMLGRDGVVRVADLGLALISRGEGAGLPELTASGLVVGTVDYMAPEQAEDTHDIDIRADLYSLGATLFKLLTGRAPLDDPALDTPLRKLSALSRRPAPSVGSRRAGLPPGLVALADRLLARDRDERPATPAEVAEALAPFATGADLVGLAARASGETADVRLPDEVETSTESFEADDPVAPEGPAKAGPGAASAEGRRDRGRPRLAVALGVALLLAGLAAWWLVGPFRSKGAPAGAADREREMAKAVLGVGGRVEILTGDQSVVVERIADLPETSFSISDIYSENIVKFNDTILAGLVGLKGLRTLYINNTGVTDVGVGRLGEIATLRLIDVRETAVTGRGIESLAGLRDLRTLLISDTRDVTDATLRRLERLQGLEKLFLKHTDITNQGLESLSRLDFLADLDLRDNQIDDEGLRHLHSLKRLRKLGLEGSKVTPAGVAALVKALPLCEIDPMRNR